ncbi:MAG TPA: hypothetical protein PKU80_01320 [Candidatus Limiplasma sp.]|nr:hypothetical protein [Candidatus Limiplasma sp.]HRX08866.1 hypothetical protein [Candidatus Limiplasma sp.]
MKKTFEHLLGLNAKDALAILKSAGIFDVRITFTSAPAPLHARPGSQPEDDARTHSALEGIAGQFTVSEDDDALAPPDPLLEPELTDGLITQARVIGVRDDGRQLIVSRFRVSPKVPDAPVPGV